MKNKLKRVLGLTEAVFYGIGIIVGAGIFILVGKAAGVAGNAVWLSFIISAIVASFTGLSYAELSSIFPKASAEFIYVKRTYKNELWAFIISWLILFSGLASIATVSLGFASYANALFHIPIILAAPMVIIFTSFLCYLGIKESSTVNIILIAIQLLALALIIALGMVTIFGSPKKINYFDMPFGFQGILTAVTFTFFAYLGFEDIVNIAEETKNPKKNIPRAIILALIITTSIYVLTAISAVSLVSWSELSRSSAPLAFATLKFLGNAGFIFISFAALIATLTTIIGIIIFVSRMMYGMAVERAFPKSFSFLHPKRKTPVTALVTIAIVSIMFLFFGKIEVLAQISTFGVIVSFIAVNLSLIWLRYMQPELKRPFRAPLNIGKYPLTAFFGIFTCFLLLFQYPFPILGFSLVLVIGGLVYYICLKKLFNNF